MNLGSEATKIFKKNSAKKSFIPFKLITFDNITQALYMSNLSVHSQSQITPVFQTTSYQRQKALITLEFIYCGANQT